jgi:hypothetical protein
MRDVLLEFLTKRNLGGGGNSGCSACRGQVKPSELSASKDL